MREAKHPRRSTRAYGAAVRKLSEGKLHRGSAVRQLRWTEGRKEWGRRRGEGERKERGKDGSRSKESLPSSRPVDLHILVAVWRRNPFRCRGIFHLLAGGGDFGLCRRVDRRPKEAVNLHAGEERVNANVRFTGGQTKPCICTHGNGEA